MSSLPAQPADVAWPTHGWSTAAPGADVDVARLDAAMSSIASISGDGGRSLATLVVHRGRIVAERYGDGVDNDTTLISWSMAKSIVHAVFGILVADGSVDVEAVAPVPELAGAPVTIRHLLTMTSGLGFVEDYVDDSVSDCLEMLFGSGRQDGARYAATRPLLHEPGTVWNYSSGTSNILSRIAGDIVSGGGDPQAREHAMTSFLHDRLFGPLGMASAVAQFDDAGTFVGSSYVYATARDFARFGTLYLRDGDWDGTRILPAGWVDAARTVVAVDPEPPHFGYGAHWWVWPEPPGAFGAHGYEGQYIVVVPSRDLVVVQLSKVPAGVREPLLVQLRNILAAFPDVDGLLLPAEHVC